MLNADDDNVCDMAEGFGGSVLTFGIRRAADVTAKNITYDRGRASFDLCHGSMKKHVTLAVCGEHNVYNALAAAACAILCGIPSGAIVTGLGNFRGAKRRLEFKGKLGGADVYDDYAHHPTEIAATLDAARQMGYDRVICVYQPHTYSRTKGLFDEFAAALGKADLPILCDIYAARETDTLGVSSELLAKATRGAVYMESFDRVADYLREHARAGDLILTMGAGDIAKLAGLLLGEK